MQTVSILGWVAAGLVLTNFYLKTMLALRMVTIASNLAFISYGALAGSRLACRTGLLLRV